MITTNKRDENFSHPFITLLQPQTTYNFIDMKPIYIKITYSPCDYNLVTFAA